MIPTVKVKSDVSPGGYFVINESDFNSQIHQLHSDMDQFEMMDKPALTDYLDANSIKYDKRLSETKLREIARAN